ncbi:interleukin-2 receptor subunit alpha [Pteronotus mesoamericanus]|uniref:interleukin-2 receptor subunit alpha n=1 Tax=Pteronotus mesoamericanus TaxID=1884717 RepID=UPI0023ECB3DC|nr:interleukin-2 receptor subunit alpha [Pteronotus parnellii mesoamericanus]
MDRSLLMWRFFTFIMVTDCVIDLCYHKPLTVTNATYKALTYKIGTLINCECKKGFRRTSARAPFMNCTGKAGHLSWENQCQCKNTSFRNTQKQATAKPEEREEGKTTEMQSEMQPTDQVNLDYCTEPPSWKHEGPERIYHFVVGQTIHYECVHGFRALQRGPAKSTCKMICGEARWTQPQLTCIRESDKTSQASTVTPSEDEASCPLITAGTTTDFEKHTEEATTMKMFIFTTEYQIGVAGCALLLIGILLLSAFIWQRRWRKNRRTI